jgi:hypothetical protein
MHVVSNLLDKSRIYARCFKIVSELLRRTTDTWSEILTQQASIVTNYLLLYSIGALLRVQKLLVWGYETFLAVGHVKICQENLSLFPS